MIRKTQNSVFCSGFVESEKHLRIKESIMFLYLIRNLKVFKKIKFLCSQVFILFREVLKRFILLFDEQIFSNIFNFFKPSSFVHPVTKMLINTM